MLRIIESTYLSHSDSPAGRDNTRKARRSTQEGMSTHSYAIIGKPGLIGNYESIPKNSAIETLIESIPKNNYESGERDTRSAWNSRASRSHQ